MRILAANGMNVVLVARNLPNPLAPSSMQGYNCVISGTQEKLEAVRESITSEHNVSCLVIPFDVARGDYGKRRASCFWLSCLQPRLFRP